MNPAAEPLKTKLKSNPETPTKAASRSVPPDNDPLKANAQAWRGFKPGLWQRDINVRWFLQQNYTPFEGDASFLFPDLFRPLSRWRKKRGVSLERGIVLLEEPANIDVSLPKAGFESAPGLFRVRKRRRRFLLLLRCRFFFGCGYRNHDCWLAFDALVDGFSKGSGFEPDRLRSFPCSGCSCPCRCRPGF